MGDDFFGGNDDFDFNDLFGVGGTGNNSNDILNDAMGGFTAASTTAASSSSGAASNAASNAASGVPDTTTGGGGGGGGGSFQQSQFDHSDIFGPVSSSSSPAGSQYFQPAVSGSGSAAGSAGNNNSIIAPVSSLVPGTGAVTATQPTFSSTKLTLQQQPQPVFATKTSAASVSGLQHAPMAKVTTLQPLAKSQFVLTTSQAGGTAPPLMQVLPTPQTPSLSVGSLQQTPQPPQAGRLPLVTTSSVIGGASLPQQPQQQQVIGGLAPGQVIASAQPMIGGDTAVSGATPVSGLQQPVMALSSAGGAAAVVTSLQSNPGGGILQQSPILIQQQAAPPSVSVAGQQNPLITIMKPTVSSAAAVTSPAVLPITVSQPQQSTSAGGTLFLQQQPPVVAQQGLAIGGAAAATAAAAGGAQPQVKIITPSGPHTIQQVQTPSGPKLIAVPVGQAAAVTATATPQAASFAQVSLPTVPMAAVATPTSQPQQPMLIPAQQLGVPSTPGAPASTPTTPGATAQAATAPATPTSSKKEKKSRKRKGKSLAEQTSGVLSSALEDANRKAAESKAQQQQHVQQPPVLDALGELIQDVGLEEFGGEGFADADMATAALQGAPSLVQQTLPDQPSPSVATGAGVASALLQQPQQLASTLQFQPQVVAASSGGPAAIIAATGTPTVAPTPVLPNAQQTATAPALLTGATAAQPQPPPGSQLVSQIQQPLPFQSPPSGFQLVQGPDGNFTILQSTNTQPAQAILSQPSIGFIGTPSTSGTAIVQQQPTLTPTVISTDQQQQLQQPQPAIAVIGGAVPGAQAALPTPAPATPLTSATPGPATPSAAAPGTPTKPPTTPGGGTSSSTGATPPKQRRHNADPNKIPLEHDSRLPTGWHRKVSQRKSGASAGRYEVFIIGPQGKRFRSRNELKAYVQKTGNNTFDPDDFDFSTFGSSNITSGRAPPTPPGIPPDASTITPTRSHKSKMARQNNQQQQSSSTQGPSSSAPSTSGTAAASSPKVHLPDVVPTTSPGLCSPNTPQQQPQPQTNPQLPQQPHQNIGKQGTLTVQHIQQPVPPEKAFIQASSSSTSLPMSSADLLQKLPKDPLPPNSLSNGAGGSGNKDATGSGSAERPYIQSQLSMEVTKGEQLTELLDSWYNNPQAQDIADELFGSSGNPDLDGVGTSKLTVPPTSSSSSPDTSHGFQQANFLSSLAGASSSSSSPALQLQPQQLFGQASSSLGVNNAVEASNTVASTAVTGTLTTTPAGAVGGGGGLTLGGSQSEILALSQNLPQNTRMVKGPNGVFSLQKVLPIELTQEMQANLRIVQTLMQELERKSSKNPNEETELAKLLLKQQQILSTGKPIEKHVSTLNLPKPSLSTATNTVSTYAPNSHLASMIIQPNPSSKPLPTELPQQPVPVSSIASASSATSSGGGGGGIRPPPGSVALQVPNSSGSPFSQAAVPTAASGGPHQLPHQLQQLNFRPAGSSAGPLPPSLTVARTSINTAASLQSTSTTASSTGRPQGNALGLGGSGGIPPLTEKQKQIVAEFKAKLNSLPTQSQRDAYTSQHKDALIKRLDFQPSQLQQLKQQRPPVGTLATGGIQAVVRPVVAGPAANIASQVQHIQQPVNIPTGLRQQQPLPVQGVSVKVPLQQIPAAVIRQLPTQPQPPEQLNGLAKLTPPPPPPPPLGATVISLNPTPEPPTPQPPSANQHSRTKMIAFVESQLRNDQNGAVKPNYKSPFLNREDACKRLLRYHVFNEIDADPAVVAQEEEEFEDKSQGLLNRFQGLVNKYHQLLIKESLRTCSSSEEVMLARVWDSDEKQLLDQERALVKAGGTLDEVPVLPSESDRDRYRSLVEVERAKKAKEQAEEEDRRKAELEIANSGDSRQDEEMKSAETPIESHTTAVGSKSTEAVIPSKSEAMSFLGLKLSKISEGATSNNWNMASNGKRNASGGDLEDDEDFGLRDVEPSGHNVAALLNSVVSNDDSNSSSGNAGIRSAGGDLDLFNSHQQDAINSILDNNLGPGQAERMDTPDMDSFGGIGIFDSIDDVTSAASSSDPGGTVLGQPDAATEAAVNSIPRF